MWQGAVENKGKCCYGNRFPARTELTAVRGAGAMGGVLVDSFLLCVCFVCCLDKLSSERKGEWREKERERER